MSVRGISGVGELSTPGAALGWTIVIGTAALVFVGTLLLRPKQG